MNDNQKKYVLVTGASGGLGTASVNELLKSGYFVFACDKTINEEKKENLLNIQMDIVSDDDIKKVYNIVLNYTKNLYAIINLAGIFMLDSIVEGTEDRLRQIIEVNFFGAYKVNKIFLPLLDKKIGRIINATSELAGYSVAPFNGYYTISKVLIDKYSDVLRRELNYTNIKVIKVRSGSFKSKLLNNANSEYNFLIEKTTNYYNQLTKLKSLMDGELKKNNSPIIFGRLINNICNEKKPKMCYNIKRSLKLRLLDILPEKIQDIIYKEMIK